MLNWEFLLQKKGDESWLPLEAASVEILEGYYRLAARSSLRQAPITVNLQYYPLDSSHPPLQTSQVKNSNADGLLIALTYTQLTPGIWQVGCSLGNSVLGKLQFDVSPLSFDSEALELEAEIIEQSELSFTPDQSLANSVELGLASIPATSELLEPTENTTLSLEEALRTSEKTTEQIFGEVSQLLSDRPETKVLPQSLLQLEQHQFVLAHGQLLEISGTTEILSDLEVTLNLPQEMRTILKQRFPKNTALNGDRPYFFNLQIDLPAQNGVLVGTVQLLPSDLSLDLSEHITYQAISVTFPSSTDRANSLEPPTLERPSLSRSIDLPTFSSPALQKPTESIIPSTAKENSHSLLLPNSNSDRLLDKLQQFSQPVDDSAFPSASRHESQLESLYQDLDRLLAQPLPEVESVTPIPSQQPSQTSLPAQSQTASQSPSIPAPTPPQPSQIITNLPRHQALPVPILHTDTTEVTAGYPLVMIVELPAIARGFAVKLWAKDVQTRQMLDGPRWLMDFKPVNDSLQVTTQITIPLGTLEILFEAVTVELQSQRESYKAKLSLAVVPPNLSTNSGFSWVGE
jgi:hypothetical protein